MSQFDLPPAYDPKPVEAKWYTSWEEAGLFHVVPDTERPPFCITIPPPNVTGELHIGHALCYEVQDILGRLQRMQGDAVLLLPGTDHAGIATQNVVERDIAKDGTDRHKLGREAFLQRVWKWREHYGGTIERQFRALGFSFDWRRNRFTMDPDYVDAVLEAFERFYRDGLIYRGTRVINWCPRCHTAISDIEVEDQEINGKLYNITYPLADGSQEIVVATTRPETMLGDTAVAVHPEDERYASIIGKEVLLPLTDRRIPVVADEHANPQFGSGAVKITPAHDFDDFEVGRRHNLENILVIDENGKMLLDREDLGQAKKYHRLDRFDARKEILADLQSGNFLRQEEDYTIRLSHCERCGTVLEPRTSLQWFMRMRKDNGELENIVRHALEPVKNGTIRFVPERWGKVYIEWMENIRDWCISRQLWWGHRIPVWYCKDCNHTNVAKSAPEKCESCNSTNLEQEEDVLDTWFSSALWPFATLGWPQQTPDLKFYYPTQAMVTSSQIIFLWVSRMIMTGVYFMGDIPFPVVHINPTVLNWEGKRMSKSLGTGIDPLEMTSQYGTDAARFGLIWQSSGQEVRFTDERLEAGRNFCNKIWNAARLVLSTIADANLTPADLAAVPAQVAADGGFAERWIMARLDETIQKTRQSLDRDRFDEAARGLHEFFWSEFCDWYLEIAKLEINAADSTAPDKRLIQATLAFVLENTLRLLHPFLPFITEEIWQHLPHSGDFVMTAPYPQPFGVSQSQAQEQMGLLIALTTAIRRTRADRKVPPKEWINIDLVSQHRGLAELIEQNSVLVASLARAKQIAIATDTSLAGTPDRIGATDLEAARAHAVEPQVSGATLAEIYLSREVTAETTKAEIARLKKLLEQAQAEVERTDKKLSNEAFASRAPAEVVDKIRSRNSQAKAEIKSLNGAIERLTAQLNQQ